MKVKRRQLPVRQEKQLEDARAENAALTEKLEKQALTMQYIAEMSDIYIPEEDTDEQNVYDLAGDEV
nr:MAG TPA: hypothetical protein [Caudoviricetes sp.]